MSLTIPHESHCSTDGQYPRRSPIWLHATIILGSVSDNHSYFNTMKQRNCTCLNIV